MTQPTTIQPAISLQASCHIHPFTGLASCFDQLFESPENAIATTDVHEHANVISNLNTNMGVGSHLNADGLVGDECIQLKDDAHFMSHGSAGGQLMPVTVDAKMDILDGDVMVDKDMCLAMNDSVDVNVAMYGGADAVVAVGIGVLPVDGDVLEGDHWQAADPFGGDPDNRVEANSFEVLNPESPLDLNFLDPHIAHNFSLQLPTPSPISFCTSSSSSSFTSILNTNATCLPSRFQTFSFKFPFTFSLSTINSFRSILIHWDFSKTRTHDYSCFCYSSLSFSAIIVYLLLVFRINGVRPRACINALLLYHFLIQLDGTHWQ